MRRPALLAAVAASALSSALVLCAETARAHLLPPQQGTVNVVGAGVFAAISVPASSLHGVDDHHDGVIDVRELDRHEAELRAEIDRRLAILDGSTLATTVRVDLMLSPQHDAAGGRADQIIVLKHAELPAPPRDLRVHCDLFGPGEAARSLTVTATRHPASGTETEVSVLTPAAPDHGFFAPAAPALLGGIGHGGRSAAALGSLAALAAALVIVSRSRRSQRGTRRAASQIAARSGSVGSAGAAFSSHPTSASSGSSAIA